MSDQNIYWYQTAGLEEYECSDEYMEELNKQLNELAAKEDDESDTLAKRRSN